MKYLWRVLLVLIAVAALAVWWHTAPDHETGDAPQLAQADTAAASSAPDASGPGNTPQPPPNTDTVSRGRQLVALGDCQSCHTTRGGAPFAGGRPIPTPFGTFYSPNITPDPDVGLGSWSATDFWHALHNGYSKDGTLLYPTFPYTNYSKISRGDSDAIYAYLRTVAPSTQHNRPHEIKFPYNHRVLLAGWRWLFFKPGVYEIDSSHDAEWNRGAYLVQGLTHCSACHETRNSLGATQAQAGPSGGLVLDWYAPSLTNPHEAGLQGWSDADVVGLLKTGRTANAVTVGPMAEVVAQSLQHASDPDLHAMAVYLKSLPATDSTANKQQYTLPPQVEAAGKDLYDKNCADCHGDKGEGHEPAAPALAGNRAVTLPSAVNSIRMVLFGGYAPGTEGNPRPFGMPPYSLVLSDEEIASVLDYVRTSRGNSAPPVLGERVGANRGSPVW
jgi:mono/diheme cytochrome c family protein